MMRNEKICRLRLSSESQFPKLDTDNKIFLKTSLHKKVKKDMNDDMICHAMTDMREFEGHDMKYKKSLELKRVRSDVKSVKSRHEKQVKSSILRYFKPKSSPDTPHFT